MGTPCAGAPLEADIGKLLSDPALTRIEPPAPTTAPASPDPAPVPFELAPNSNGVAVKSSLGGLREYNAKLLQRKIEDAKKSSSAPKDLVLPKPAAPQNLPLDLWSSVDAKGIETSAGKGVRVGAGADYKLTKNTTFGVLAETGETAPALAAHAIEDQKLAAYMALRATPAFSIDARTEWTAAAPVPGDPAAAAPAPPATENSKLILAPRLGKQFTLGSATTLSPFVTMKSEIDLGQGSTLAPTQSIGAGVSLAEQKSYSLNLTTDVEGLAREEPANVKSRLQLNVPLH